MGNKLLKSSPAYELLAGIVILVLGELGLPLLLMISTSIIVLSAITLAAAVTSSVISEKLNKT